MGPINAQPRRPSLTLGTSRGKCPARNEPGHSLLHHCTHATVSHRGCPEQHAGEVGVRVEHVSKERRSVDAWR